MSENAPTQNPLFEVEIQATVRKTYVIPAPNETEAREQAHQQFNILNEDGVNEHYKEEILSVKPVKNPPPNERALVVQTVTGASITVGCAETGETLGSFVRHPEVAPDKQLTTLEMGRIGRLLSTSLAVDNLKVAPQDAEPALPEKVETLFMVELHDLDGIPRRLLFEKEVIDWILADDDTLPEDAYEIMVSTGGVADPTTPDRLFQAHKKSYSDLRGTTPDLSDSSFQCYVTNSTYYNDIKLRYAAKFPIFEPDNIAHLINWLDANPQYRLAEKTFTEDDI